MLTPEDDPQRDWHFRQLKWSLQALARCGSEQRALFPDLVVRADDLAFDFDHWASFVRETYADDLSPPQLETLAAIERKLATISRDGDEFDVELWSEAALGTSEHWASVRVLARSALDAFGW